MLSRRSYFIKRIQILPKQQKLFHPKLGFHVYQQKWEYCRQLRKKCNFWSWRCLYLIPWIGRLSWLWLCFCWRLLNSQKWTWSHLQPFKYFPSHRGSNWWEYLQSKIKTCSFFHHHELTRLKLKLIRKKAKNIDPESNIIIWWLWGYE